MHKEQKRIRTATLVALMALISSPAAAQLREASGVVPDGAVAFPLRQRSIAGDGLPRNVEITNIVADARRPTHLFAGTAGRGVFRSVDAGDTWRPTGAVR